MSHPLDPIDREHCRRTDIATPLRRLLREAIRDLEASEGTIWVFSEQGTHLDAALNVGPLPDTVERQSVPVDDSVVGMVATTGLATCIGPDDEHNPTVDAATGTPTLAMAAAPIRARRQNCGVLSAINPTQGSRLFSGDDLEKLEWKAFLIGIVLEALDAAESLQD